METSVIDSHFHSQLLNSYDFSSVMGIDIGTCCDDLPKRYELLNKYPNIKLSAAMGPWECGKSLSKTITDVEKYGFRTIQEINSDFERLINNIDLYNPLFIGECGLDYYWMYATREIQIELFEKHFQLAEKLKKAIIIHNREADSDTAALIKAHNVKTGIIHCFSGDEILMKTALDKGFYISFAGNLTFKKNTELREMLKKVPKARLLLETDSPYLTPVPFRGQQNTPDKVKYTYLCASETLGIPLVELSEQISQNYNNLCTL